MQHTCQELIFPLIVKVVVESTTWRDDRYAPMRRISNRVNSVDEDFQEEKQNRRILITEKQLLDRAHRQVQGTHQLVVLHKNQWLIMVQQYTKNSCHHNAHRTHVD